MDGNFPHEAVLKHQQISQEKHRPILASPTRFVPEKPAPFTQASLQFGHTVNEDVTARPSFQLHTLPDPVSPSPTTSAFHSFSPPSQASKFHPHPVSATTGFPDIKPFIQLGPTAAAGPSSLPRHIHQNSISLGTMGMLPSLFSARKVPQVEDPVQVFHHGSPLFLSQIRSISVTSEPPLQGVNIPTATPRNLDSLARQELQVFGPEKAFNTTWLFPQERGSSSQQRFLLSWRLNLPPFTWAEVGRHGLPFMIPTPSPGPGILPVQEYGDGVLGQCREDRALDGSTVRGQPALFLDRRPAGRKQTVGNRFPPKYLQSAPFCRSVSWPSGSRERVNRGVFPWSSKVPINRIMIISTNIILFISTKIIMI